MNAEIQFSAAVQGLQSGALQPDDFDRTLTELIEQKPDCLGDLFVSLERLQENLKPQIYEHIQGRLNDTLRRHVDRMQTTDSNIFHDVQEVEKTVAGPAGGSEKTQPEGLATGQDAAALDSEKTQLEPPAGRDAAASDSEKTQLEPPAGRDAAASDSDKTQLEPPAGQDAAASDSGKRDLEATFTPAVHTGTLNTASEDTTRCIDQTTGLPMPGHVIKDRFVLETILGEGGMGVVYKAKDILRVEAFDKNPYVAIKILNQSFAQHSESFIAMQREASKAQRLAHPGIGTVHDFDRDIDLLYITMELLEGMELRQFIKELPAGGLSPERAIAVVVNIAEPLAHAHNSGLVHSDLKPGNIFYLKSGRTKIIDFGIARASKIQGSEVDAGGEKTVFDPGKLGALTPAYASCEMFDGQSPHASDDIYALGCMAYELLTGKHPYNKLPAPKAMLQNLSPPWIGGLDRRQNRTLARSVAFLRNDRCQSVDEFLQGLLPRKSYLKQWLAAAVLLLAASAGGGYLWYEDYKLKQRDDMFISILQGSDQAAIKGVVSTLNQIGEKSRENILKESRTSLLEHYRIQVEALLNGSEGPKFSEALHLLEQIRVYYPDSAVLLTLREQQQQQQDEFVADLSERYNEALESGKLLPDKDYLGINAVLDTLAKSLPEHALLSDQRLPLAFAAQIEAMLEKRNYKQAEVLLAAASQYHSRHARLTGLRFRVQSVLRDQERSKQRQQIGQRLAPLTKSAWRLPLATEVVDDLVQWYQIAPADKAFQKLQKTLQGRLQESLQRAIKASDFVTAESLLQHHAPALSLDFLQQQRQALSRSERQLSATVGQADSAVFQELENTIQQRLQEASFDGAWYHSLWHAYRRLLAMHPQGRDGVQDFQQQIGEVYLQQVVRLGTENAFGVALQALADARRLLGEQNQLQQQRVVIKTAEQDYQKGLAEEARQARIAGYKQTLLAQVMSRRLDKIAENITALKEEVGAEDPFLRTKLPPLLADAYLRLAADEAAKKRYSQALALLQNVVLWQPEHPQLAVLQADYKWQKDAFQGRSLLRAAVLDKAALERNMQLLQQRYPARFTEYSVGVAEILVAQIQRLEGSDLAQAHELLAFSRRLLPQQKNLLDLRLKELPKPSVYASKGLVSVAEKRLSEASNLLAQARQQEAKHKDVGVLTRRLEAAQSSAEKHHAVYRTAVDRRAYKAALTAMQQAQAAWLDNDDWKQELLRLEKQVHLIAGGARLCDKNLAGYGRKKRAVCNDVVAGGTRGPLLVVIPAPSGGAVYAISKYEISSKEFSHYCRVTKRCTPLRQKTGLPATGIAARDMQGYADWLSENSGFRYRLPALNEWLHAASAGGREKNKDYNCRLKLGNKLIKGHALLTVDSGKPNRWGLVNYVGNAQELVTSGGAYLAVGGSFAETMSQCTVKLAKQSSGQADDNTGFRLLRDVQ